MRSLFVFSALALFGCVDNALPIENGASSTSGGGSTAGTTAGGTTAGGTTAGGTTAGTTAGSTTAGTTTAGTTTAGTTTAGTTTAGTSSSTGTGGQGAMCGSACDCKAGLACFQSQCVNGIMGVTLYCCDDAKGCPDGQFCQSSDGSFGMCGGGSNGTTTGNAGTCKTACDCPTGEACFQGSCITPPTGKLYCCDDPAGNICPAGGFCQSSSGGLMMCPGGGGGGGGPVDFGTGGPRDGGVGPNCGMIKCASDTDCQNAGCGSCRRNGVCR